MLIFFHRMFLEYVYVLVSIQRKMLDSDLKKKKLHLSVCVINLDHIKAPIYYPCIFNKYGYIYRCFTKCVFLLCKNIINLNRICMVENSKRKVCGSIT